MAKEIEVLYNLKTSIKEANKKLHHLNSAGSSRTVDTYFFDPLRDELKQHKDGKIYQCLRLRETPNKSTLTYKLDHYDNGLWCYSDEHETPIESHAEALAILKHLGLKELVIVDNTKYYFTDSDGKFELVLEDVKNLGGFVEVEWKLGDTDDVLAAKEEIRRFVCSLGLDIGEELNSGKPELLLNQMTR